MLLCGRVRRLMLVMWLFMFIRYRRLIGTLSLVMRRLIVWVMRVRLTLVLYDLVTNLTVNVL